MPRRSYDQYCPLAKALDVVGDRWTMLILRELAFGPRRFTDLEERLVGIAPNLLTDRLRHLEAHGVISRRKLSPPAASHVYELTETGRGLERGMLELARWGTRFLGEMKEGEAFYIEWLLPMLEQFANREAARGVNETYEFRIEGSAFHVIVADGEVTVRPGRSPSPYDLMIETDFATFAAVGFEAISPQQAREQGRSRMEGDPETLERALDILAPARTLSRVVAA